MFYLKLDSEVVILDCIEYPHEGYQQIQNESMPDGVNGGWWKYINGAFVEIVEKNPNTIENKIQKAIDDYTLLLIESGVL